MASEMKLVTVNGNREVLGKNAAMKLMLARFTATTEELAEKRKHKFAREIEVMDKCLDNFQTP